MNKKDYNLFLIKKFIDIISNMDVEKTTSKGEKYIDRTYKHLTKNVVKYLDDKIPCMLFNDINHKTYIMSDSEVRIFEELKNVRIEELNNYIAQLNEEERLEKQRISREQKRERDKKRREKFEKENEKFYHGETDIEPVDPILSDEE